MRFWLAVESASNWSADRENGFRFLGIADTRMARAKQVAAGDFVFVYVPSPIRCFADVRLVAKDGVHRSSHVRNYDIPCYAGILTEPLIPNERPTWLPISAVKDDLSFGNQPGAGMRVSFREIARKDAAVILSAIRTHAPDIDEAAMRRAEDRMAVTV